MKSTCVKSAPNSKKTLPAQRFRVSKNERITAENGCRIVGGEIRARFLLEEMLRNVRESWNFPESHPSVSPPNSSKVFLSSTSQPRPLSAHSRQRQKSVGMKTPNATRMGNIRLLLSVAYGFGVLGPDWTRDLETAWARFFPPSSPPSLSSSSSSSSSGFSRPG